MNPLIKLISRVFLALALCVSAPTLADVNEKDDWGWTPLHWAAENGEFTQAKLLIQRGADVNAVTNKTLSSTPLHFAAYGGNHRIVYLLIENGADVEAKDRWGLTPLFSARTENAEKIARALVDAGADVNAKSKWGDTPLHAAAKRFFGSVGFTKVLLSAGADVNARGWEGETPLHAAVTECWLPRPEETTVEVVLILIDAGAEVNAKTNNGKTPLDYAVVLNKRKISEVLIANGGYCNVTAGNSLCGENTAPPEPVQPEPVPASAEPSTDYTGLYANAGFAIAGLLAPDWVDTQTFAFKEGDKLLTGQSLSVPMDDFTFAATRVQVNDLTDYEFSVKWEMVF